MNILSAVLFVLFIVLVSASVTDKLLEIPLLEVGETWNYMYSLLANSSPYFYIFLGIFGIVGFLGKRLLFEPLDRVRLLGDVGYQADGKWDMKEIVNSVRKRRLVGEIPPVYPNGWFGLTESFRIKKGESKNISVLGLNLAVFRDEKGEAHVLDAYCPHLGANLSVGGKVVGDCLECPFHGWRFRGHDGKCTYIPYAETIPDIAKVKSWPSMEINGWIYMWHHAEGLDPNWTPPEVPEITNGSYTYRGRTEHIINCHIEEVPENGADVVHLRHVHEPSIAAGTDLDKMWNILWSFSHHTWSASWEPHAAPEEHVSTLTLSHSMKFFGKRLAPLDLKVSARQIGPGIVYLDFVSLFGKGVFIHNLTPIEPMVQRLVHNIYVSWTYPTFVAKFFMLGEAIQVERDIMIWNNKKYIDKPMFVKSKEDSVIARHRRWYSQFYSENSPRLKFQKEALDW
ncbi:hypothetical protein ACJMK2_038535 [Sinanodonta woodiana]|uniref:cholesterol 7-desaturase n=1 Tax=Sinanodonta woodiana TaxID=1069815 RepID=A0ABD3WAD2_SINWO